ncbi:MAG TPA: hypothetical protein H9830_01420 [Candidatus Agrococcus pullicola]|uniref:Uncharacterized protein n=1 Tax=Candidatus Agrococcus pullicola TaxID=2838429 RepID=A0A9D1YSA6_9MICO|nr:hypothetical protein [Candidatus Agrococcus pullicola]
MSTSEGVRPRRRSGAIITLLIGVALVIIVPLTGVVGALFSGIGGAIQSSQRPVIVSPNPNLIELREGREVRLLVPATEPAPHVDACAITAPSGAEIEAHALPQVPATEERYGSDRYYAFGRFQATENGAHVIDCSASEGVVAASVEHASPWILPLVWLGAAVIGILIGAMLMIIGITRLVRVSGHNRAAKRAANPNVENPAAHHEPTGESAPRHPGDGSRDQQDTTPPASEATEKNTAIALGPARTDPTQQRDASIPNPAPNSQQSREVQNPAPEVGQSGEQVKNPLGREPAERDEENPGQARPADDDATEKS